MVVISALLSGKQNETAMLHSITWGQFGLVIFISLVLYYGYIVVRYYGRDLRGFAQGKKNGVDRKGAMSRPAQNTTEPATVSSSGGSQTGGRDGYSPNDLPRDRRRNYSR